MLNNIKKIPAATIIRYWLFQIPGILVVISGTYILSIFTDWNVLFYIGIPLIWLIKDACLLPVTWKSYDNNRAEMQHSMEKRVGIVKKDLNPDGIVEIGIEKWHAVPARKNLVIKAGTVVIIEEQKGMVLTVHPQENGKAGP